MSGPGTPRGGRRLVPEARRLQIINAARPLFAARPVSQVTMADIAEAADVSRPLVYTHFSSPSDVFLAVVAESGAAQVDARTAAPPTPLHKRLVLNVPAAIDAVVANREIWFAVMGHRHSSGQPEVDEIATAITEFNVQRTLENNSDLLEDTPATRAALHAVFAMSIEAMRQYFEGNFTRAQLESFLIGMSRAAFKDVIRKLESTPEPE